MRCQSFARAWFAAALLGSTAFGTTLQLNGAVSLVADQGAPLSIAIGGTAGHTAVLLYDLFPGPTTVFGQSVALGFSPALGIIVLGPLPPGGTMVLPTVVPTLPGIEQITVYLAAGTVDPALPAKLTFSNGASLTIQEPPDAGLPQLTMVGHATVIASKGLAAPNGQLKPGVAVSWALMQSPAGSTAALENPTKPWPSIVPDVPGDYVVQATVTKYGKPYVDTAVVHACKLAFNGYGNGDILLGDTNVNGTLSGPPGLSLEADGQPLPLTGNAFGPLAVVFPVGEYFDQFVFEIRHTDGSAVATTRGFVKGTSLSVDSAAASSMLAQLTPSGITLLAESAESVLETTDLEAPIKALPAVELVDQPGPFGGTLFSAYADVLAFDYNPQLSLAQSPKTTGLDSTIVMNNLVVTVKINGEISNIPYSLTGTATANPATFKGNVALAPSGSALAVNVTSTSVTLTNFGFTLGGFPGTGSQLNEIKSKLASWFASALSSQFVTAVKAAMKAVYDSLGQGYSLVPSGGNPVNILPSFASVTHSASSLRFAMSASMATPTPEPGAPLLTKFLSIPSQLPAIPAPPSPHDIATAISTDFINLGLVKNAIAGAFESVDQAVTGAVQDVGDLAPQFPVLDLSTIAADTPIVLDVHADTAPFAVPTAGGPGKARIYFLGVEFAIHADFGDYVAPLVRVSVDATIDVDFGVDPDGTLAVSVVQVAASGVGMGTGFAEVGADLWSFVSEPVVGFVQDAGELIVASLKNMLEVLRPANLWSTLLSIGQSIVEEITSIPDWFGSFVDLPG